MLFVYRFKPDKEAPTAVVGLGRIGANLVCDNAERPADQQVNQALFVEPRGAAWVAASIRRRIGNRPFPGEVKAVNGDTVEVNGRKIRVYHPKALDDIPAKLYEREGIQRVVEATGLRVEAEKARAHRQGPVKQVLVTANAKGAPNLFLGLNEQNYKPEEHDVIGGASCTTGSVAKTAEKMNDKFGVQAIFLTTGHAHTGKSQAQLIQWTESGIRPNELTDVDEAALEHTGAAEGAEDIVPGIRGTLKAALSIRGPVVNGSYTVLDFVLTTETTQEGILEALQEISKEFPRVLAVPGDLEPSEKFKGSFAASVGTTKGVRRYKTSGVVALIQGSGKFWRIVIGYNNEEGPARAYNDLALYTEDRGENLGEVKVAA